MQLTELCFGITFDVSLLVQVTYYSNFLTRILCISSGWTGSGHASTKPFWYQRILFIKPLKFFTVITVARILNSSFLLFQKLICEYIFIFRLDFFSSSEKINLKLSYDFLKPFWISVPIFLNAVLIWRSCRRLGSIK